jgi:hypothetical protein
MNHSSFRDAPSVGNCRPEATDPESIRPVVVMDSGLIAEPVIGPRGACHRARIRATRWRGPVGAPRNDDVGRSNDRPFRQLLVFCVWRCPDMANQGLPGDAPERRFVETIQSDLPSPAPFAKIFRFAADPNHFYIPAVPPHRGALASGAGCDGRGSVGHAT